jgi:FtsH-binding integral membrane protein
MRWWNELLVAIAMMSAPLLVGIVVGIVVAWLAGSEFWGLISALLSVLIFMGAIFHMRKKWGG